MRSNKPSRLSQRDEASTKITPEGQLIGPLVHKIFNLDSCPKATHKQTQNIPETYTYVHTHIHSQDSKSQISGET